MWKILKILGTVLTVILALITIWNWITRPTQKLIAEVQYGPILLPPNIKQEFKKLQEIPKNDWIKQIIEEQLKQTDLKSKQDLKYFVGELTLKIRQHLRDAIPYDTPGLINDYRGFWLVTVHNGGSQAVQDVRLFLPDAVVASIKREGADGVEKTVSEAIDLGAVQPQEEIQVIAWTQSHLFRFNAERIRLTHANGIGHVIIVAPVGAFGQFMDRYWVPLLFAIPLLLLLLFSIFAGVVNTQTSQSSDRESEKPK